MNDFNQRGFDGDAQFTSLLSLLTGVLTFGLSHLYILFQVRKRAVSCPSSVDQLSAIAVPGHQLKEGRISDDYRLRLDRAAVLYRASGDAAIRILGGRPHEGLSEAQAGCRYLEGQGIPRTAISLEEASTNTLENLRHSRDWFAEFDEVVLVSNRYHLERLQTFASGVNLRTLPCAAEEEVNLSWPKLVSETFFLHWYWVGRLYASLTRNRRMLDKIS